MSICKIWMPSHQHYIRMHEMTCEQYRDILKNIDDSYDFNFCLNQILSNNMFDKSINIGNYTIIDKLLLFLQLRIYSCGSALNLTSKCDKCDSSTDFTVDLNNILDYLSPILDRSFNQTFQLGTIKITCNLPIITFDEYMISPNSIDERIDLYMFSFFRSMSIGDNVINLNELSVDEKNSICAELPFNLIYSIKNEYIEKIHEILKNAIVIRNTCKTKSCGEKLALNIDIQNMNDIIKIFFRDENAISILSKYANVSHNCNFGFEAFKNISPLELNLLYNMETKQEAPEPEKSVNLFDEYGFDDHQMVESPSEFI